MNYQHMIFGQKEFIGAWNIWKSKGHDPMTKLKLFESPADSGTLYSLGIVDYVTLESVVFPNRSLFTNREAAFASIGRALDAAHLD